MTSRILLRRINGLQVEALLKYQQNRLRKPSLTDSITMGVVMCLQDQARRIFNWPLRQFQ